MLVVLDLSYIWILFFFFCFEGIIQYPLVSIAADENSDANLFPYRQHFDLSLEVFRVLFCGVLRLHKMNIREWEEQYLASGSSVPWEYRRLKMSYTEFKSLAPGPRS